MKLEERIWNQNSQPANQFECVYLAFKTYPMTMKECDVLTGIMRENICRYVAQLEKAGKIKVRNIRKCTVTGDNNVKEWTADPNLFPPDNQLDLFDGF